MNEVKGLIGVVC